MYKSLKISVLIVISLLLWSQPAVQAQDSDRFSKIEVGAQFSSLAVGPTLPRNAIAPEFTALSSSREPGVGGRFSLNVTSHLAFDSEVNFFPRNEPLGGSLVQALFGVKGGKRFKKFGLFAKARPGVASFNDITTEDGIDTVGQPPLQFNVPHFDVRRRNFFSMDVGGVVELYHSRRIFTRIDFGDTIIRYGRGLFFDFDENTARSPGQTRHVIQFSAGISFRIR